MNAAFPVLTTERLRLRPLEPGDLEFVFQHFSDPEVGRYLLDDDPVTTPAQAQEIVDFYLSPQAKSYNRWIIERQADGRPAGTLGFHKWSSRYHKAEVGFDLSRFAWGQGYMTEALQRALDYGFTDMELNRVEAVVYPENSASLKLLERLGFVREGLMRQEICRDGVFYDHWLLSLLRSEWPGRPTQNGRLRR